MLILFLDIHFNKTNVRFAPILLTILSSSFDKDFVTLFKLF